MIYSVYRNDENYYAKQLLEKYNFSYDIKYSDEKNSNEQMHRFITKKTRKVISSHPEMQRERFFWEI